MHDTFEGASDESNHLVIIITVAVSSLLLVILMALVIIKLTKFYGKHHIKPNILFP